MSQAPQTQTLLYRLDKHETGRCEHCEEQETVERNEYMCREYERERQQMKDGLEKLKERYDLLNVLRKMSGDRCYMYIIDYLKGTRLINKIG